MDLSVGAEEEIAAAHSAADASGAPAGEDDEQAPDAGAVSASPLQSRGGGGKRKPRKKNAGKRKEGGGNGTITTPSKKSAEANADGNPQQAPSTPGEEGVSFSSDVGLRIQVGADAAADGEHEIVPVAGEEDEEQDEEEADPFAVPGDKPKDSIWGTPVRDTSMLNLDLDSPTPTPIAFAAAAAEQELVDAASSASSAEEEAEVGLPTVTVYKISVPDVESESAIEAPGAVAVAMNEAAAAEAGDVDISDVGLLKADLATAVNTVSVLQSELEAMERRNAEESRVLRETNKALSAQFDALKTKYADAVDRAEEHRAILEAEVRSCKEDIADLKSRSLNSERALEAANQRSVGLYAELSAASKKVNALMLSTGKEFAALRNAVRDAEARRNVAETELRVARATIDELNGLSSNLRSQVSALEDKGEAEEGEIAELKKQIEAFQADVSKLRGDKCTLETKLGMERSGIETLEETVTSLTSTIEELRAENESKSSLITDLHSTVDISQRSEEELRVQMDELHSIIEQLTAQLTTCKTELSSALKSIDSLSKSHNDVQAQNNQLQRERDTLAARVRELEAAAARSLGLGSPGNPPPARPGAIIGSPDKSVSGAWGGDMSCISPNRDDTSFDSMSYAGVTDQNLIEEIAKLRASVHESNTELARLQDLYVDACAKNEAAQTELAQVRAHQEVSAFVAPSSRAPAVPLGPAPGLPRVQSGADMRLPDEHQILQELIKAKVFGATMATELDQQKKRASGLEKSLKMYSQRIVQLETDLAQRDSVIASRNSKKFSMPSLKSPSAASGSSAAASAMKRPPLPPKRPIY